MKYIKVVIIVFAVLFIGGAIAVLLGQAFPSLRDPNNDEWFVEEIHRFSVSYLQTEFSTDKKIVVTKIYYNEFDMDIVNSNRNTENKVFPFQGLKVIAESYDEEYMLEIAVNHQGKLQVVKVETEKNFNPFLR